MLHVQTVRGDRQSCGACRHAHRDMCIANGQTFFEWFFIRETEKKFRLSIIVLIHSYLLIPYTHFNIFIKSNTPIAFCAMKTNNFKR